jgi:hypothetical protein
MVKRVRGHGSRGALPAARAAVRRHNRGIQQIREWLYAGLAINGVKPEDVPSDVEL